MNTITFMAIAVLGITAVNFSHWLTRKHSRFFYLPSSGWSRKGLIAVITVNALCALLFLAGATPELLFVSLLFGGLSTHELYSIWSRHHQRTA